MWIDPLQGVRQGPSSSAGIRVVVPILGWHRIYLENLAMTEVRACAEILIYSWGAAWALGSLHALQTALLCVRSWRRERGSPVRRERVSQWVSPWLVDVK